MKQSNHCIIVLLTLVLVGCSSTKPDSAFDRAVSQIQPGITKQAVYTALGQPVREAGREVEWEGHEGGKDWRVVIVSFDENGRVTAIRSHGEQR